MGIYVTHSGKVNDGRRTWPPDTLLSNGGEAPTRRRADVLDQRGSRPVSGRGAKFALDTRTESAGRTMPRKDGRSGSGRRIRWAALALLAAAAALVVLTGAHHQLSPRALVSHYATFKSFLSAHWWQGLAIYAAGYAGLIALSVPGGLADDGRGRAVLRLGSSAARRRSSRRRSGRRSCSSWRARRSARRWRSGPASASAPCAKASARTRRATCCSCGSCRSSRSGSSTSRPPCSASACRPSSSRPSSASRPATFAFSVLGAGLDSVVAQQAEALGGVPAGGGRPCRLPGIP